MEFFAIEIGYIGKASPFFKAEIFQQAYTGFISVK